MDLIHGGDIQGYIDESGREPLDFSANGNPLGTPAAVKEAVALAMEQASRYPDPLCRRLTRAIADKFGVDPSFILCGAGSADLLYRLGPALQAKKALIPAPTFAEYEEGLTGSGCEICYYPLRREDRFAVTEEILDALTPDIDVFYLCSPNNPTGLTVDPALLRKILVRTAECGIRFVMDECFNPFLDDPEGNSLLLFLAEHPNLLILKAFTKMYGMAGVRLGYCLTSDTALLARMRAAAQPWAVSSLAEEAGIAALACNDFVEETRALVEKERAWMTGQLEAMPVDLWHGSANYLFFYDKTAPEHPQGEGLVSFLRANGILIRDCANYVGLGEGYCRIAVLDHDKNARLMATMRGYFPHRVV